MLNVFKVAEEEFHFFFVEFLIEFNKGTFVINISLIFL